MTAGPLPARLPTPPLLALNYRRSSYVGEIIAVRVAVAASTIHHGHVIVRSRDDGREIDDDLSTVSVFAAKPVPCGRVFISSNFIGSFFFNYGSNELLGVFTISIDSKKIDLTMIHPKETLLQADCAV